MTVKKLTWKQVIALLYKLECGMPNNLWLFCDGDIKLMKTKPDGERAMLPNDGGVDPAYVVYTAHISSDGGDW